MQLHLLSDDPISQWTEWRIVIRDIVQSVADQVLGLFERRLDEKLNAHLDANVVRLVNVREEVMVALSRFDHALERNEKCVHTTLNVMEKVRQEATRQRKELSKETRRIHREVIRKYRNGHCPCCENNKVVDENGLRLEGAEYDHFFDPSKNDVTQTWLTCGPCNRELFQMSEFKFEHFDKFKSYQQLVREHHMMQRVFRFK